MRAVGCTRSVARTWRVTASDWRGVGAWGVERQNHFLTTSQPRLNHERHQPHTVAAQPGSRGRRVQRQWGMRNSKVRARIAAGKLNLRVRDLRNLGTRTEQMLAQIGVYSATELRRRGPVRAFAELKRAGVSSSINLLWALAGALEPWPEGQHWREVSRGDARLSLLLALDDYERRMPGRGSP